MNPDKLYELALQYKKTKLWKRLWDSQLFAVRFSDGGIGYCCVMGMMGELNAIAVYPGQKGLDSLRKLQEDIPMLEDLAQNERMHCQDCLMLSFMNKSELNPRDIEDIDAYCKMNSLSLRGKKAFPQFERFRTGYERWYLEDEIDQRHLIEGLEAAIEVSRRLTCEMKTPEQLGLFEGAPFDRTIPLLTKENDAYRWEAFPLPPMEPVELPPIVIDDDLSRARLEKAPRKGEWGVKLFRHIFPLTDQPESDCVLFDDLTKPPFYPWVLAIVELKTGCIIDFSLSDSADEYARSLSPALINAVTNYGMPSKIIVLDDRTAQVMRRFCEDFDVKLEKKKRCKALQNALDDMIEHFISAEQDDDIEDELDAIIDLLRQPEIVSNMPDELLKQLFTQTDPSAFPEDIQELLFSEGIRRGLIEDE